MTEPVLESYDFMDVVREKFAEIIRRHNLEIVFYHPQPGLLDEVGMVNSKCAILVYFEHQDGLIDFYYGRNQSKFTSGKMERSQLPRGPSFRNFLMEQGIHIPYGRDVWTKASVEQILGMFAYECLQWESVVFAD